MTQNFRKIFSIIITMAFLIGLPQYAYAENQAVYSPENVTSDSCAVLDTDSIANPYDNPDVFSSSLIDSSSGSEDSEINSVQRGSGNDTNSLKTMAARKAPATNSWKPEVSQNIDLSVTVDWSKILGTDNATGIYKVFQKENGGEWNSIGMDYDSVNNINVLQVYPSDASKNQISTWMVDNGYGKGLMNVSSVYIDTFNSDASTYLYNNPTFSSKHPDVIIFGTTDSNSGKDLTSASRDAVKNYIEQGYGVIFGHDTLYYGSHPYFASLASYCRLKMASISWATYNGSVVKTKN